MESRSYLFVIDHLSSGGAQQQGWTWFNRHPLYSPVMNCRIPAIFSGRKS